MAPEDKVRAVAGAAAAERVRDHERDGVEIEVVFPGKGLIIWATPDAKFAMAMCRAWNRWAHEAYAGYEQRILPMAAIGPRIARERSPRSLGRRSKAFAV